MKTILLSIVSFAFALASSGQAVLNEVYTDPGNGKDEFFELYNTSTSTLPMSLDNVTIVTFFETPTQKGFMVMDLPNLSMASKGFFVGASAIPFDYQGTLNSTASDFSWNDPSFMTNNGYIKKWVYQSNNLSDGNVAYDEIILPADFNDFFFRRTANGASYTIFLYKDGVLINALIFGTGGLNTIIPEIITLPPLFVDMSGSSPDFTIDFSTYGSVPIETVSQDAGSDNGFIRERDGLCGGWDKSSAQVQHTPQVSNGDVDRTLGFISANAVIEKGTEATGSTLIYDVVAGPASSFPVELQVYKDNGTNSMRLDGSDLYVESNTETVVTDGPFSTLFFPYDMNMLLVVKSNVGCIDKVLFIPNVDILPVKLIFFQGSISGNNVLLQWKVGENESADRFEIEKSVDGIHFSTAATIYGSQEGKEDSYSYSETFEGTQKIFYRLKIFNKNQMLSYSSILSFGKNVNQQKLTVVNNPAKDRLNINFQSAYSQQVDLYIYDLSGKLQLKQSAKVNEGTNMLSVPLNNFSNSGMYIAELVSAFERKTVKFVKQ